MEYPSELVKKLGEPGIIQTVNGVPVECKAVPDGPANALDPRELKRQQENGGTWDPNASLQEQRDRMGGFNYNLNRKEIWTKYLLVPTSCGDVPVWCYYPRRMGTARPALVYVHGGGFFGGSVYTVENQCRLIAERADCSVWNVDYSLAPQHPYPTACIQVYEMIRHLFDHAAQYNVAQDSIMVAGDSAGGNIAAVAAQMDRDRGTNYVAGQVLIYAKLAFTSYGLPGYVWDEHMFRIVDEQKHMLKDLLALGTDAANKQCAANYVQGREELCAPYVSPAFGKAEGLAKTLMIQAEYDGLRLEGEFYARKLLDAGVPVRMIRYCGTAHAFFDGLGILPQAEAAVNEIADFLQM